MKSEESIPALLSVQCIWKGAKHSAFTDLIYFKNTYFCCFRESDSHAGGKPGKIRILASDDSKQWTSVALLSLKDVDLRDPMFSITSEGKLLLNMGGMRYFKNKIFSNSSFVAFSSDGHQWNPIVDLAEIDPSLEHEWIWRLTWHKGIGYGVSYSAPSPKDRKIPWIVTLVTTLDGVHYNCIQQLEVPNWPSEVTLRFQADDTLVALIRRGGGGYIGTASFPYKEWTFFESAHRLGGPNFLILPDGTMLACSRHFKRVGAKRRRMDVTTALYRMGLEQLEPVLELPSGGDTSYPGMVYRENQLLISYYSSHEDKSKIYLATLKL